MTNLNASKKARAVFVLCAATAIAASAQTFTTLAIFDGNNGATPNSAPLMQGADGNFYGMAFHGGLGGGGYGGCPDGSGFGCGTAFKIVPQGAFVVINNFCTQANCTDGVNPNGNLILGVDGNVYGTTSRGGNSISCVYGCGTFFRITPAGKLTTLYNFCATDTSCIDGASPNVLIQASDGNFYGTTDSGGFDQRLFCATGVAFAPGCGTVFKITPSGKLTTLYRFCSLPNCADGQFPLGGVIEAADGNFYGLTTYGGNESCEYTGGCGTVFKMSPRGDLTTLYTFCSQANCTDGALPAGALVRASETTFYGTTTTGGANSGGTIFKITRTGEFTSLHSFDYVGDGAGPLAGLTLASDGHFYGTTCCGGGNSAYGTIFRVTAGGTLTTLYSLNSGDGEGSGGLLQATSGIFYSTTEYGGSFTCHNQPPYSCGTIFSFSVGLRPFVTFVSAAGKVGQTGGILGQGFTGTTSVSLNGIPASFTVVSDTFIKATVPTGATTGYVTVTTPSGTLTSNVPFHVIK